MESDDTGNRPSVFPRWPGYLLGTYAIVAGVVAFISLQVYPQGWAVYSRPLLAAWGLAGGLLLWLGDPWWKPLLLLWILAQAAVVVVDPSGDLTRQPGFFFGIKHIAYSTSNGQVIQAHGYGVNFWGVVLFLVAQWIISHKWYPLVPGNLWQFKALRLVRLFFVVFNLLVLGHVGWHWGRLLTEPKPLLVISCPPPGAVVYAEDHKLGSTPLVVTQDKLVEWNLSRAGGPAVARVAPSGFDEGFKLSGNSRATTILLRPPWWCRQSFVTFSSEWGPRAIPINNTASSCGGGAMLIAKAQSGLVLDSVSAPASCLAGRPFDLTVTLHRNPVDPRVTIDIPSYSGEEAALIVTFGRKTSYSTEKVRLPAAWASPAVGAALQQAVPVSAPRTPGHYEYRVEYALYANTNTLQRLDGGSVRNYGVLEVK